MRWAEEGNAALWGAAETPVSIPRQEPQRLQARRLRNSRRGNAAQEDKAAKPQVAKTRKRRAARPRRPTACARRVPGASAPAPHRADRRREGSLWATT